MSYSDKSFTALMEVRVNRLIFGDARPVPPVRSLLLKAARVNLRDKQHTNSSSPPLLFLFFAVPSIQRQEAGLLLVCGQIRAASARL